MRRRTGQLNLVEGLVAGKLGRNVRLERVDAFIDWPPLEALLAPIYAAPTGRPAWPLPTMIRALLLQQWYALSDPGLEEALADRLSFRRFCGLGLDEGTPDHSTISRSRAQLASRGLAEALLAEVNRQLEAKGLMVKAGTLIDATLVEAAVGYKAHLAVDYGSDLIRGATLTGADVGESLAADGLVQGDEGAVYADKAYDSRARRDALAAAGIAYGLMHRAHPRRQLKPWQKWLNVALAPIRGQVERVFGLMKRSYGYRRVRYRGLVRNRCHLALLCAAINLRRALRLAA
jgi:IS5 family transposase